VLVTHDLDEVLQVADRVTVLRDGRSMATTSTRGLDRSRLAELIVGRPLAESPPTRRPRARGEAVLIRGLAGAGVADLSLDVPLGEIVGLTGASGAGFEEVPYLLFGARRARQGRLVVCGRELDLVSARPHLTVRSGLALVPGDRRDGAAGSLSLVENLTLPTLGRYGRAVLRRRRMAADASALLERFGVRPARRQLPLGALSGGNQQKAVIARCLARRPRVLVLCEPTAGVDVATRIALYKLIADQAERGLAVIVSSTDVGDLLAMCTRVLVLRDGVIARELPGDGLTETTLHHAIEGVED
jgi:ribose transport system ATP-binding protein